jgi:uncharacterized protein YggE
MKNLAMVLISVALLGAVSPASKNVTITVNGEATISQAPDTASIGLSIVTAAPVAQTATSDNNSRYNDLRNRLHAIGITDDAIRTLSFNVSNYIAPQPMPMGVLQQSMRPIPNPDTPGPRFTVVRQVEIMLKNLDLVGSAVDQAVAANVSNVYNVAYSISNYRTLYAQALKGAVTDAQMQAKAMASAAGMHIVRVSAMQSGGFYPRPMMVRAMSAQAPGAPPIPTEIQQPGSLDVHANVTVTYIIAP